MALTLLTTVSLAGCSRGEGAQAHPQGQQGQGGGGAPRGPGGPGGFNRGPQGPTPVEVAQVTRGSLARTTTVAGILSPIRTIGVNAQLGGALLSVRVEEGDLVREGQVLAEIDAREIRAQLRSAEANLELAKSTVERSERLFEGRVVTAAEFERDKAAHASAQASVDALRLRLAYAQVRAPTSGVITAKRAEAGDVVSAQARLFTVADVSILVALIQVSELDISGLSVGQSADVTVDAFGPAHFPGKIRRIFPAADSVTRMVPVEVALSGPEVRQLKPGYLARVTVQLGERPGILLAPVSSIVGTRDARAVYVIHDGKAERRQVRIGQSTAESVEVLEGLTEGDSVVIAGADQLRDGAAIRIVAPIGAPVRSQ